MMKTKRTGIGLLCVCWAAGAALAATPAELTALMAQGERITVVDIRSPGLFQAGHIPGAINVPERVLARKKLPPLGRVVVCGRGLGSEDIAKAVQLLNAKSGIQAEALEGGYAAWQTERGQTTQAAGFQPERLDYIAYADLSKINSPDVVLVDLRKPNKPVPGRLTRQGTTAAAPPLTPLSEKFPGRSVVSSPLAVPAVAARTNGKTSRMGTADPVPMMVLIDNGDGEAEKTARMLRANGIKRVVILAGGEHILARDGAPGLKRMGTKMQMVEESK